MNVYDADKVRNVALVGHQGSGKTILAEAMLYTSHGTNRIGKIEDGTSVSDYRSSEHERQMSIYTSLLNAEWNDHKINILDTPGYPDFAGEVISALKVADIAIFVINGAEGVQVGTEAAWAYAEKLNKPVMFVVNKLDGPDVSFETIIEPLQQRFGHGATVIQLPGGTGSKSIVDVLVMKQVSFKGDGREMEYGEIGSESMDRAEELHNELVENIAENDEELMELYFEKGNLSESEMRDGLHEAMLRRQLFPIFLTSARENIGVGRLLDFIVNACPSPVDFKEVETETGEVKPSPEASPAALIFRTVSEQHVGDYSFMKAYGGTFSQGMDLENAQTREIERLGPLYVMNGNHRETVDRLVAGDIGAVVKLKDTHTNNTLREKGDDVVLTPIEFPAPRYTMAVRASKAGDEDKLGQGLSLLVNEDPSLIVNHDTSLNQLLLGGQGDMHLEIAKNRLKDRFGIDIEFFTPRISYRETVTSRGDFSYRHKKQTGGAGQFADITLFVEPGDQEFDPPGNISVRNTDEIETSWGSTITYIDAIVGGVIDMRRFFGAIQKGIAEALQEGPLAGYPVGDLRIVIYDGGMHSVDSNENAFKTAARTCFQAAFGKAKPVMLEPIHELEVMVPEEYMGDVLGDLNTRRARVQGMEGEGIFQKIRAVVPEAELHRYSTSLRSLTQGRGMHTSRFLQYEAVPRQIQEEIIKAARKEEEE